MIQHIIMDQIMVILLQDIISKIDIWTKTYQKLVAGNELLNPVTGDYLTLGDALQLLPIIEIKVSLDPTDDNNQILYDPEGAYTITGLQLRGTGKDLRLLAADGSPKPAGSVASAAAVIKFNPFQKLGLIVLLIVHHRMAVHPI